MCAHSNPMFPTVPLCSPPSPCVPHRPLVFPTVPLCSPPSPCVLHRGLGGYNMREDLTPPFSHVVRPYHRLPCDEGSAGSFIPQLPYSTCMSGLGVQSRMQSGLSVFRRQHKKTPSRSERAKSTRSTSGLVTRCVAGMTPLLISHCRACLHSNESTFMILRKRVPLDRDTLATWLQDAIQWRTG